MFRRRDPQDFSEELRAHLALEADRFRAEGCDDVEAWRLAHLQLGNLMMHEEGYYERTRWTWLEHLRQDVRHSLRLLWQAPGFSIMAILTLALGIGATTAIFTLMHTVLLKSLPVAHPEQLYTIGEAKHVGVFSGIETEWDIFSYDLYQYLRDHTTGFEELAAFQGDPRRIGVRRSGDPRGAEAYIAEYVSGNYFATFQVAAATGRAISSGDDRPGGPPVAVMAYRTWQDKYALDPTVIGSTFSMNGAPLTVIGVAPPGFFGDTLRGNAPDFWIPLAHEPLVNRAAWVKNPKLHWLYLMGRVKPGSNVKTMEAQLQVALQQWLTNRVGELGSGVAALIPHQTLHLHPGGSGIGILRATYSSGLRLLMAISGFVLAIVCANLANLLIVRGLGRRRQTSISLALGASRSRVMQQALTESVVFALLGGVAGVGIAFAGTRALVTAVFAGARSAPIDAAPDLTVLAFACAVSVLTGILCGIAPAWSASRADPIDALRGGGRLTAQVHSLPQRTLVVIQAAMSLVLLAAAGLLTDSLWNLQHQRFGFAAEGRVAVRTDPNLAGYKVDQLEALYRRIHESLKELPGCVSVSYALYSPMSGSSWTTDVAIEGQAPPAVDGQNSTAWNRVGPEYFETVGTPILQGRAILESDTANTRHVAVINEAFARRYFPNQDPMGKHFGGAGRFDAAYEIVGVAADAKYLQPGQPVVPMFFVPRSQSTNYKDAGTMAFETRSLYVNDIVLRFSKRPATLDDQIRRIFAEIDPNLTVIRIQTFDAQVGGQFNQPALIARLTALFGLTALLLASIGLYGLISYSVAQRSREIGIRLALGANRKALFAMVLRSAYSLVGLGLMIGIPCALAMGRLLGKQLFGVKSYSPLILTGAVLVLASCALAATIAPARRAMGLDPTVTLRCD